MNPLNFGSRLIPQKRRASHAFTLVETLVASAVFMVIAAGVFTFISLASTRMSGITAQSTINDQTANAIQFIQSRARIATYASNDASGAILTLGFDDNYTKDSDGDGLAYNDADHFETFQIVGNSVSVQSSTNSLVYTSPNRAQKVLIPSGVCKLPQQNLFTVTNKATVLIRLAVVDSYAKDQYQSIDIRTASVLLNRRSSTNVISILP